MTDTGIHQIDTLVQIYAPDQKNAILAAVDEVVGLYQGGWHRWLACKAPYHDLSHALAVTRLTLELQAGFMLGWGQDADWDMVPLCLAALLHDSGYLMTVDEPAGDSDDGRMWRGGQHTFGHVRRGCVLTQEFLRAGLWEERIVEQVQTLILATEYIPALQVDRDTDSCMQRLQRILKTADLLAQVGAPDYVERLQDLYAEFVEAYAAVGKETLHNKGVKVYASFHELKRESAGFLRWQVVPMLQELGCMDTYLTRFYAANSGENLSLTPYHRQLRRNINKLEEWLSLETITPA